uniref:Uncharacterized protein n=1 Tax=Cucumis melo TaxID=3656 RepID=A0A9I9E6Y2_CUCME
MKNFDKVVDVGSNRKLLFVTPKPCTSVWKLVRFKVIKVALSTEKLPQSQVTMKAGQSLSQLISVSFGRGTRARRHVLHVK